MNKSKTGKLIIRLMNCINVNIPVVTLYSRFIRSYLWGKWVKGREISMQYCFLFCFVFCFFERGRAHAHTLTAPTSRRGAEGEGEREFSSLVGLDLTTMRSWLKLILKVRCLTTQVPLNAVLFLKTECKLTIISTEIV